MPHITLIKVHPTICNDCRESCLTGHEHYPVVIASMSVHDFLKKSSKTVTCNKMCILICICITASSNGLLLESSFNWPKSPITGWIFWSLGGREMAESQEEVLKSTFLSDHLHNIIPGCYGSFYPVILKGAQNGCAHIQPDVFEPDCFGGLVVSV